MSESDYQTHVAKNARRVFNMAPTYTLEELRSRFKTLARKHHPDKGGRPEEFEYLQACFKHLHEQLMVERPFHELRQQAKAQGGPSAVEPRARLRTDESGFAAKFNRFYDENRFGDEVNDRGHGDFINEASVQVDNGKRYAMQRYRPPSPIILRGQLNFVELGESSTDDFSERPSNHQGLVYTDYRVAHSTNKLVDEVHTRAREEFSTVDELEARRSAETFDVSAEEERMYEAERSRLTAEEQERIRRVRVRDETAFEHFSRVNNRLAMSH